MFQDYCSAHGRPCEAGSLYCCAECRELDVEAYYQSPVGSPLSVASTSDDYLLYECFYCNAHHEPNEACTGHSYALGHDDTNFNIAREPIDPIFSQDSLEVLGNGNRKNSDISIDDSNHLIENNYRKWLVNMTPR